MSDLIRFDLIWQQRTSILGKLPQKVLPIESCQCWSSTIEKMYKLRCFTFALEVLKESSLCNKPWFSD